MLSAPDLENIFSIHFLFWPGLPPNVIVIAPLVAWKNGPLLFSKIWQDIWRMPRYLWRTLNFMRKWNIYSQILLRKHSSKCANLVEHGFMTRIYFSKINIRIRANGLFRFWKWAKLAQDSSPWLRADCEWNWFSKLFSIISKLSENDKTFYTFFIPMNR